MLDYLTGDDVRHLTQAEDELVVRGRFERIFPTADTHSYFCFMDVSYYNRLFDAWENSHEKNRKRGTVEIGYNGRIPPVLSLYSNWLEKWVIFSASRYWFAEMFVHAKDPPEGRLPELDSKGKLRKFSTWLLSFVLVFFSPNSQFNLLPKFSITFVLMRICKG